jgi:ankyrin repeat protein
MRESLSGTIIRTSSVNSSRDSLRNEADIALRNYLDEQLELLKEAQRGNIESISRIIRDSPSLADTPELAEEANKKKQFILINELGQAGWGILHTAVYYEHPELVTFLPVKNCNPNLVTTDGWTLLQLAVTKKSQKMMQTLLEYPSALVNVVTSRSSALHIAVRDEMVEIVKLLFENKANEYLKDEDGITPL